MADPKYEVSPAANIIETILDLAEKHEVHEYIVDATEQAS